MQLTVLAALSALTLSQSLPRALADQVTYDPVYDNANQSLATVECSTGTNGLLTHNFTTFSSLPTFPFIGGAQAVEGFNSAQCGSCWNITFNGSSITLTAVDHADSGFNIAQSALDNLTHGQAVQLGVVQATATQLNSSACGL